MSTWKFLATRRDFAKLITARFVSMLGDYVHTVTTMWLVKEMTDSASAMAAVIIANTIPRIIFSLLGGVSVDRYDRKTILVLSDSLRAIGVLGLVLLAIMNQLQVWQVALFAAFNGAVASFFMPAVSATVPNIVESRELQQANAVREMSARIAGILGGAMGGIVLGWADVWSGYLFDATSYALSALLILSMAIPKLSQIRTRSKSPGVYGVWQDTKEGWAFIFSQRGLFAMVVLSVVVVLVILPAGQLIPTLANELKLTDPALLGFLWSGITLGMFLGAFFLNAVRQIPNKTIGVLIATLLCGVSSLLIGVGSNYFVVLCGFFLMGFSSSVSMLLTTILFQTLVPNEMQGRFFGNTGLLTLGIQPLVMGLAGWGADWSSAAMIFTWLGGGSMILGLLWASQYRKYLKTSFAFQTSSTDI